MAEFAERLAKMTGEELADWWTDNMHPEGRLQTMPWEHSLAAHREIVARLRLEAAASQGETNG